MTAPILPKNYAIWSASLVFQHIPYQVFIEQSLVPLAGIHQGAITDAVDAPWDTGEFPVDLI